MKNVLDFFKAKQMKEAGFPQPVESEYGQIWYDGYGGVYVVQKNDVRITQISNGDVLSGLGALDIVIFAPTCEDILKQIANLFEDSHKPSLCQYTSGWTCGYVMPYGFDSDTMTHEFMIDAAYEMWNIRFGRR